MAYRCFWYVLLQFIIYGELRSRVLYIVLPKHFSDYEECEEEILLGEADDSFHFN